MDANRSVRAQNERLNPSVLALRVESGVPYGHPVVDIRVLMNVRRALESAGVPFGDLARRCGIEPGRLEGREQRFVSLNSVGLLFERAADELQDPDFGLKAGIAMPAGGTGLLGHIMLTSSSVGEMLRVAERYMALFQRPISAEYAGRDGEGTLSWTYPPQFTAPRIQYSLYSLAALVGRIRQVVGPGWMPASVQCDFLPPADATVLHRMLGYRIEFQQSRVGLTVDAAALATPIPPVLDGLEVSVRDLGDRMLAEIGHSDTHRAAVEAHVRRRMIEGLALQLEEVAADMGLTARALQYRLDVEKTGFEAVLGSVRSSEALRYLRDTDLTLTEIAQKLGFSEQSAFTRAMRHRFDMAPREMRRRLRDGEPLSLMLS